MKCTFREVIEILEAHGFTLQRQNGTSHCVYRGAVGGLVRIVVVAGHLSDDVKPGTLDSIIRQSGLPKKHFRK